jgi:hypothetical protein
MLKISHHVYRKSQTLQTVSTQSFTFHNCSLREFCPRRDKHGIVNFLLTNEITPYGSTRPPLTRKRVEFSAALAAHSVTVSRQGANRSQAGGRRLTKMAQVEATATQRLR